MDEVSLTFERGMDVFNFGLNIGVDLLLLIQCPLVLLNLYGDQFLVIASLQERIKKSSIE